MLDRAWLGVACVLAACGGSSTGGPADAASDDDAPSDASGADARTDASGLTTTVHVTRGTASTSGTTVLFSDAQGGLVATRVTGADGLASAPLPAGGMVTVIDDQVQDDEADYPVPYTVVDIASGSTLEAALPELPDPAAATLTVAVTYPAADNGGAYVTITIGDLCWTSDSVSASGGTVVMTLPASCVRPGGTLSAFATQRYGSFLPFVGNTSSIATGVSLSTTAITLGAWNVSSATVGVSVTGTSALDGQCGFSGLLRNLPQWRHTTGFPVATGTASVSTRVGPGDAYYLDCLLFVPEGNVYLRQVVEPGTTTITHDHSASLPVVSSVTTDRTSAPPTFTMSVSGATANADAIVDIVQLFDAQESQRGEWVFILPPERTTPVPLPVLPGAFSGATPVASDEISHWIWPLDVNGLTATQVRQDPIRWVRRLRTQPLESTPYALRALEQSF